MDRHLSSFEQYCTVVGRNIILQETTYHNGAKAIRCLNLHNCENIGGCKNKFVLARVGKAEKREQIGK